jgi:hypothetical protein
LQFAVADLQSFCDAAPVVRIVQQSCANGRCRQTWSSGTVIGRDQATGRLAVLTCAHGRQADAPWLVEIEPGQGFEEGQLTSLAADDDLALLLVAHPARTAIIPIGDVSPQPGEPVIVGGFQLAKFRRPRETRVKNCHAGAFDVAETFAQGESGGPAVFNDTLVGVIRGNDLPTDSIGNAPPASRSDGTLTCLSRIRRFVERSLGGVPQPAPATGAKSGSQAELSARGQAVGASARGTPASGLPLHDSSSTPDDLRTHVAGALKAELPKILAEHLGPVEERLAAGLREHGLALKRAPVEVKKALLPELPAIGRQVLADALPQVRSSLAAAIPGLLPTVLAVIGGVGIPGAGGLALAGWLAARAIRRHTSVLSAVVGHLGRTSQLSVGSSQLSRGTGPSQAIPTDHGQLTTDQTVNTSVAEIVTEIGTEAYQRMKGDLIRKNPALANDGTIKLMDSLFTQHLSGLQIAKSASHA